MWGLILFAGPTEDEGLTRWQKIVNLKNSSQTDELIAEADEQMEWFRKHSQWDKYYRTWQLKANSLSAEGKLQLSLQETQRMLSDAKERDNTLGRAMAYKQIGVIYLNMKQTEPAIEALQHYAELMKDEEDDISSLSNIYYRMAKAYDYDKAYTLELGVTNQWLEFLNKKERKADKIEIKECYNSCYLARAASFIGQKRLDEAEQALRIAAQYAHQSNTALSLHHFYKMQARYYLAKGDANKALLYTDSVRLITNEHDEHLEDVKAQALILLGKGEEAAHIYRRLYQERDSVFGREARQHLDELNTLFQVDELKKEQERTKYLYMNITVCSIVLALLLLLFYGWRNALRQKKKNEELRIANERAKVSSKMKAEFIRNISHEIRTPLNIVSGFTQILTSPDIKLGDNEKKDIKDRVTENTDRITRQVDRMLEMSDVSSEAVIKRTDKTNVQEIISEAINHSRINLHTRPGNAESKVEFLFPEEESTSSITLRTNKLYAIRTLSQLLENAVKFTHEGKISLHVTSSDKTVRFTIEDTGIGIPKNEMEHIFDEFVQLDEFVDGTGIGLTVARSIARRMGGDLWLDPDYPEGARFVLELLKR